MSRSYTTHLKIAKKLKLRCKILHSLNNKNIKKYTYIYFSCPEQASISVFDDMSSKAIVIRNSIDLNKLKFSFSDLNKFRQELNIDDETILIGNVAKIDTVKNIFYLIDIFEKLAKKVKKLD